MYVNISTPEREQSALPFFSRITDIELGNAREIDTDGRRNHHASDVHTLYAFDDFAKTVLYVL